MTAKSRNVWTTTIAIFSSLVLLVSAGQYAMADLGPMVVIGPPDSSDSLDAFSDGDNIYVAYKDEGSDRVFLGVVNSGEGGRSEEEQDDPNEIAQDVRVKPHVHVASDDVFVAAGDQLAQCSNKNDDDCEEQLDFADPPTEGEGYPDSCRDEVDNDGDEGIDASDDDCFPPLEESTGLCADGIDNDDDGTIDYGDRDADADPDCYIPAENEQPDGCSDDVDNDGDGRVDRPDPDCASGSQTSLDQDNSAFQSASLASMPEGRVVPVQTEPSEECKDASTSDVTSSDNANHLYFAWEDDGDICFKARNNGAYTENIILATNGKSTSNPLVATSSDGQYVHVAWQSSDDDIYYSRIVCETDAETCTPEDPVNLSNNGGRSQDHELQVEGSNVYVAWLDFTTGAGDPYFRASKNDGDSFGSTKNLYIASHPTGPPDIGAIDNKVVVCFDDKSGSSTRHRDVFCIQSTNSGDLFDKRINVSNTRLGDSRDAQVDFTPEGEIYVGWTDTTPWEETETDIPDGKRIILASESEDGRTYSAPVNLSDSANNPDPDKDASQLEVVHDVAVWDPISRRG